MSDQPNADDDRDDQPEPRPCTVPVKPGFAQAAFKAGCEDEWIERMKYRYGGEW